MLLEILSKSKHNLTNSALCLAIGARSKAFGDVENESTAIHEQRIHVPKDLDACAFLRNVTTTRHSNRKTVPQYVSAVGLCCPSSSNFPRNSGLPIRPINVSIVTLAL
ncbi:hypothetical protein ANTPLA_LOCUS4585 [Anthophora plagiata]